VRVQDAGDSYSVSSITQSISARLTAAVRVQPCVASTVYQDAYCLPILLRIASSNDLRSQGGMNENTLSHAVLRSSLQEDGTRTGKPSLRAFVVLRVFLWHCRRLQLVHRPARALEGRPAG
jgi:hypothetical protein